MISVNYEATSVNSKMTFVNNEAASVNTKMTFAKAFAALAPAETPKNTTFCPFPPSDTPLATTAAPVRVRWLNLATLRQLGAASTQPRVFWPSPAASTRLWLALWLASPILRGCTATVFHSPPSL